MCRARHRPEEAHVVSVYRTVVVFLRPNDLFVTSDIDGQVDADATYGVLQYAVDEKCHKGLEF